MSKFTQQLDYCQTLGCKGDGGVTTCWLPKEAALIGIEVEFEHPVAIGGAEIGVIATKVEPPVRSYAPKPTTVRQVRKNASKVEHLRLPFWTIGATRGLRPRIGV